MDLYLGGNLYLCVCVCMCVTATHLRAAEWKFLYAETIYVILIEFLNICLLNDRM